MTVVSLGLPSVQRPSTPAPATGPLIDTFGRVATDLRVSLTDLCNLRCTYCMPAEGLDWMSRDQKLTPDELIRLLRIGVTRLGITSIRFTGGEPLVVPHLEDVLAATTSLQPRPEVTLTTNGIGLAQRAEGLRRAGLNRINVSLDTVDPMRFAAITRRDRFDDVIAGLRAAKDAGLKPVKVNAVLDPVTGLQDAVELLGFCLQNGYQLRIIEQMPLDAGHSWQRDRALSADDILATLRRNFTLTPDPAPRGSAPAQLWQVHDDTGVIGRVGIIASVSHAFCSTCDRSRLTADGQVRNCLFARDETDLKVLLRTGADDDALEAAWRAAMWAKAAGHGINDPGFVQPDRPMSAIGG